MFSGAKEITIALFGSHPYALLFVGMFFAGETVLLPAIYFALRGDLHLSYVIAIALAATVASDFVWYFIGSHMKNRFARRVVSGRLEKSLEKLDIAFTKRGALVLYLSKFVYGTRTAAQVLSGLHQMQLRKYVVVNFLGIFSLVSLISLIAYSIDATIERLTDIAHALEVAFLVFVCIVVLLHLVFGKYLKDIWSR